MIFAHLAQIASNLSADASALESAISALESAITALDGSSGLWEILAWLFTGAVVIGVVIEVRVLVLEHRDEMTDWRRGIVRPPDRPLRSLFICGLVGSIFVALGVAGELGVGIKVSLVNGALRSKNAELRRKSGQLIALLHIEAQEAQKAGGEANERAAKLELAVSPRRLSLEQQGEIAGACRKFSGHTFKLIIYVGDTEAIVLAEQIKAALRSVPLNFEPTGSIMTTAGLTSGIAISGPDSEKGFVDALVKALSIKGKLEHVSRSDAPVFAVEPNVVAILVGVKPYALLGQNSENKGSTKTK